MTCCLVQDSIDRLPGHHIHRIDSQSLKDSNPHDNVLRPKPGAGQDHSLHQLTQHEHTHNGHQQAVPKDAHQQLHSDGQQQGLASEQAAAGGAVPVAASHLSTNTADDIIPDPAEDAQYHHTTHPPAHVPHMTAPAPATGLYALVSMIMYCESWQNQPCNRVVALVSW